MVELLNTDLTKRMEYSADVGEQKHRYAGTGKGSRLKIGNDYKLVKEIERLIIDEKMSPYAAAESIKKSGEFAVTISYKTVYNYIDQGLFPNLTNKHLPVKKKGKKRMNNEVRTFDSILIDIFHFIFVLLCHPILQHEVQILPLAIFVIISYPQITVSC